MKLQQETGVEQEAHRHTEQLFMQQGQERDDLSRELTQLTFEYTRVAAGLEQTRVDKEHLEQEQRALVVELGECRAVKTELVTVRAELIKYQVAHARLQKESGNMMHRLETDNAALRVEKDKHLSEGRQVRTALAECEARLMQVQEEHAPCAFKLEDLRGQVERHDDAMHVAQEKIRHEMEVYQKVETQMRKIQAEAKNYDAKQSAWAERARSLEHQKVKSVEDITLIVNELQGKLGAVTDERNGLEAELLDRRKATTTAKRCYAAMIPHLGLAFIAGTSREQGIEVMEVEPGSSAQLVGMVAGDVIQNCMGATTTVKHEFWDACDGRRPGFELMLSLISKECTVPVVKILTMGAKGYSHSEVWLPSHSTRLSYICIPQNYFTIAPINRTQRQNPNTDHPHL
jgi:chromosome segregation ATPase